MPQNKVTGKRHSSVHLPEEVHKALRMQAAEEMVSQSVIVERALRRELGLMTTAERLADQLGHGQSWTTEDGTEFSDLMEDSSVDVEERDGLKRYVFADGSAIVAGSDGWDVEGSEPFSWAGAE